MCGYVKEVLRLGQSSGLTPLTKRVKVSVRGFVIFDFTWPTTQEPRLRRGLRGGRRGWGAAGCCGRGRRRGRAVALGQEVDYEVAFDAGFDFFRVGVKEDLGFGADGGNVFDGEAVGRVAQLEVEVVGELNAGDAHSESGYSANGYLHQVGAKDF